jgi:hypothetical protein
MELILGSKLRVVEDWALFKPSNLQASMPKLDFKTVVEQEKERLCRIHPAPSDILGCFSLFEDYVSCGGI